MSQTMKSGAPSARSALGRFARRSPQREPAGYGMASFVAAVWVILLLPACGGASDGAQDPPADPCDIPFAQEQIISDNQLQIRFGGTLNACLGHPSCDDIGEALAPIANLAGIHGRYFVFDGGAAEGFGAWTFPANTLVFHADTWRFAIATASLYEAYLIGIPVPGFGIPTGEINGFRATLDQITLEIANTPLGPEPVVWTLQTPEGVSFAKAFLCGVSAHEISHIKNGDAEDRICATITTGNPYVLAAFSFLRERQADIDAANLVAESYLRDPNGLPQPTGMLLLMEMLYSAERMFGSPPEYPRAVERLANVRQVFALRGVPDSLYFY